VESPRRERVMSSGIEAATSPVRGRKAASAGFTLVEVILAIVILAIGLLGMAGTTAYVVRQTTLAEVTGERSVALQSAVERIRATPYQDLGSGEMDVGLFTVSWSVAGTTSRYTDMEIVTTGPGLTSSGDGPAYLGPSVTDTFEYRVVRP